jgi:hypothetical protein
VRGGAGRATGDGRVGPRAVLRAAVRRRPRWLGVYLDAPVDWDEIAEIVEDAYRMVASKKLFDQLDGA